ncbi:TPA: hypothetical protein ACU967_002266 [Burkholderia contaminans]|uniref:hypothetical protein n=1 Tax=Burkholderia contaminans TaxID=488447 RepID=UPI000D00DF74|nr:hypothetical protein [Burkholderia contaminans]HDR9065508.1 hypothetical protein [Burkholderia vietnamiensis]MBM6427947.1 hypothetical protein [Burkholderia contaminans]MCA7876778.1 hypothetical protein [Burkholderia contaminans]MDN8024199.1 hypothetical protein [Burkholderia contaminans]PRG12198.1 hypothetical protein C6Q17_14160 [Burkholderia contaminans]
MKYGYAKAVDAERWIGGEETIEATIAAALVELHAGNPLPVSICEIESPRIAYDSVAESVIDDIQCQLEDEVGEVADTFGPFNGAAMKDLADAIEAWAAKHGDITCWKAVNMKEYKKGDAPYDAALARATTEAR